MAKNVNNKIQYESLEYPYEETNLKAKFMYGLGFDDIYEDIKDRAKVWNNEYLTTSIDDYCTVEDFKKGLQGYNLIIISEHGWFCEDVPYICTEEKVTESNMKKYKKDIEAENIVMAEVFENGEYVSYYFITPSFIEEHYKKNELKGSIVYLGCCQGYMNDKLVKSFNKAGADSVIGNIEIVYSLYDAKIQDAFVYSLLCGDTVGEALDYAKDIWGDNDIIWAEKYINGGPDKTEVAKHKIYCGEDIKLVNLKEDDEWDVIHALPLGDTLYKYAYDSYWNDMKEGNDIIDDEQNLMAWINITNIDEIKKVYTKNGFKQFMKENEIFEKNGKYYKPYGDRGMDIEYIDSTLLLEKVDKKNNKIYYTVTQTYDNTENPVVKTEFVVAKEDGEWKVDKFTLPN